MPAFPGAAHSPAPRSSAPRSAAPSSPALSLSGVSHHKVLGSISRTAVLELLRLRAEPLGVVEIAQHVGLHQNTVRSHLDLLVESGYAIRQSAAPNGPGRPRVVYESTAAPDGERSYRLLAEVLAQHIVATSESPGEAAVNAGRSWAALNGRRQHGADQHSADQHSADQHSADGEHPDDGSATEPPMSEDAAVGVVVRMLGDSGFAPELSPDGTSVSLHRCPLRELAVNHQDVVCGAHLGVIQGALADLGTMVSATRLLPFVTPGLCVTTLTRSGAVAEHPTTQADTSDTSRRTEPMVPGLS